MNFLIQLDQNLFLFLNSLHADWLDPVMWWLSDRFIWTPLYLFVLFLIINKYRWKSVGILLSIALLIAASDQFSVMLKFGVARFRPTHTQAIKESIHTLNHYFGGPYGFVSSHAANGFALATYTSFFLAPFYKNYCWLAFLWASLVAYSRIYLGVHFPGDIIGGALLGMLIAYLIHQLYNFFSSKCSNNFC